MLRKLCISLAGFPFRSPWHLLACIVVMVTCTIVGVQVSVYDVERKELLRYDFTQAAMPLLREADFTFSSTLDILRLASAGLEVRFLRTGLPRAHSLTP
jgi:hypothetical protein